MTSKISPQTTSLSIPGIVAPAHDVAVGVSPEQVAQQALVRHVRRARNVENLLNTYGMHYHKYIIHINTHCMSCICTHTHLLRKRLTLPDIPD